MCSLARRKFKKEFPQKHFNKSLDPAITRPAKTATYKNPLLITDLLTFTAKLFFPPALQVPCSGLLPRVLLAPEVSILVNENPLRTFSSIHCLGHVCTLCVIPSVVMFCWVFGGKFWLPMGVHSSWNISPPACNTCHKSLTKSHDWGDVTDCNSLCRELKCVCYYSDALPSSLPTNVVTYTTIPTPPWGHGA